MEFHRTAEVRVGSSGSRGRLVLSGDRRPQGWRGESMKRVAWAWVLAAFLMLLLVAPHVQAQNTRLSFTLCETANIDWTTESARHWVDAAGIDHWRNAEWTSTFVGTFGDGTAFTGEGSGLLSWNLDTTSYNGDLFGAFSWTFYGFRGAGDVTFSGRFSGAFTGGIISNDLVAHAEVMTLTGHAPSDSVVCPDGAEPWAGTILMPQG